jgi:glycosyltransferase involved in cell wall biosynthesis
MQELLVLTDEKEERADVTCAARDRIAKNRAVFECLVRSAEEFAAKGNGAAAVAYAGIAASFAMWNHTGTWRSDRLEQILSSVGVKIAGETSSEVAFRRSVSPKKVLHVLTQAYSVGGHTRFVWRWIQKDFRRTHSIALTRQGTKDVPEQLLAAAQASGGEVYFVDRAFGGILAWASCLRKLALTFDQIVLHMHPCDVVPVVALAQKKDLPPVMYMNHIDNVFWLGTGTADVVAHIRDSGVEVSRKLRGIEGHRCLILPIPVDNFERKLSRAEAKRQLGIPNGSVVLLSIAVEYKFEPILAEPSFTEILIPVLDKYRKAMLMVVGPEPRGHWEQGIRKFPERFKVLGPRTDTAVLYQAADVYLDSFPVSSLTSLLEAGAYTVPLLTLSFAFDRARILCADCPGFADTLVRKTDIESYQAEIGRLVENPEIRSGIGEETKKGIFAAHSENWMEHVERAYYQAATVSRPTRLGESAENFGNDFLDLRLSCIYDHPKTHHPVEEIIHSEVGALPFPQRMSLWSSRFNHRPQLLSHFFFSEWARNNARKWVSKWVGNTSS